jgi:hypothetical protein
LSQHDISPKPCPFCGSAPKMKNRSVAWSTSLARHFAIRCGACGFSPESEPTPTRAAARWNRFATDARSWKPAAGHGWPFDPDDVPA